MIVAIAVHGTRGDVEPAAAVAVELKRRGHEIRMAVPPNLIPFAESAGLTSVRAYGPDSQQQLEAEVFREWLKPRNPLTVLRQGREYVTDGWSEMGETLLTLADGADLILTGTTYQEVAANVAEFYAKPLAALHYFPARANSQSLPVPLPLTLARPTFAASEWAHWRLLKPADDAQRERLGLPRSRVRATRRIIANGTLEIQAYDKVLFPKLDEEWQGSRPIVGSISLQMPTTTDDEVVEWIAAGTPPIYFGFGSMPVANPAETVEMITDVCAELGERALICSGVLALDDRPSSERVKVVQSANHSRVFPLCRAIVHHAGAGTTAASMRSGVPTLALWVSADQIVWAGRIKKIGVGTSRRFSSTTRASLLKDLRTVLSPQCSMRAKDVAAHMSTPAESLEATADLLEHAAVRSHAQ